MVTVNPVQSSAVSPSAQTGINTGAQPALAAEMFATPSQPVPAVSTATLSLQAPTTAFTLSNSQIALAQDPSQLAESVTPVTGGLGALLNSLDTSGTSNQVNQLLQDAQQAAQSGDGLTAQKDMAQAQLLFETMSTILNSINTMQSEAIRNAKVG
jgi:hypothetical protein